MGSQVETLIFQVALLDASTHTFIDAVFTVSFPGRDDFKVYQGDDDVGYT